MIPLKDINPTRTFPFVNIALIIANLVVFCYQVTLPAHAQKLFVLANAAIPARIPAFLAGHTSAQIALTPLFTSMFLHGTFMHLAGNMLFLYIFGDNIEEVFGHVGYLFFYVFCGLASGLIHVLFNWHSAIPALGASGAISGVMGAYAVYFPRNQILTFFFIFLLPIPAIFILGYWFVLQFLAGVSGLGMAQAGGVAWWAHIGGFLIGMLVALLVKPGRK
jgi:membrane associated rhomboid family serine protease